MIHIRNNALKIASNIRKFLKLYIARFDRETIANIYIKGKGLEIGALHVPTRVPKTAKVKYIDRMTVLDLRRQYPELNNEKFVDVDIIDDSEHLSKIKDLSQDFIIANHFLEHCQNPIATINNMMRVLKKNGVLYLSIPDKRYSFDADRPVTPINHLMRDYMEGPVWSKRQHLKEWAKYIDKIKKNSEVERRVLLLDNINYSIHYHAWTQVDMLELMLTLKKKLHFNFEVELMLKNMGEVIFILRKTTNVREDT